MLERKGKAVLVRGEERQQGGGVTKGRERVEFKERKGMEGWEGDVIGRWE